LTEESTIENRVPELNKTIELELVVPETQQELLEASKVLLTKLTMLTVGDNGLDKIPGLLQQLFAGFGLEPPSITSTEATTATSIRTTTVSTTLRTRNFKHNRLSDFYKQRQSAGTSIENEEEQRIGLLSSLRSQIITSALQDRKIVAKANKIPVYSPARKVPSRRVKVFYNQPGKEETKGTDDNIQLQENLASELNNTLKSHLQSILSRVQTQKKQKEEYEESVVNSVKEQLERFTAMLDEKSFKIIPEKDNINNTKDDLAKALEAQLRSFYGDYK